MSNKQIEKTIEQILSAISEDLLFSTLEKEVASYGMDLPRSFKGDHIFYVTVYYKNKQLRSRTASNSPKENDIFDEDINTEHLKLFEKIKGQISVSGVNDFSGSFKKNNPYLALRVGEVFFIISNSNPIVVEIFAFIITTFFVMFKALLLIKEYGQIHDLLKLEKYSYGMSYLKKANSVAFGQLGGHR